MRLFPSPAKFTPFCGKAAAAAKSRPNYTHSRRREAAHRGHRFSRARRGWTLLGAACLINDLSEFERIRRQQELHVEISAEMALALRTSLTTISGYAQQLASNRDPELARQLAADIADEAAQLDHSIGGFLTERRVPKQQGRAGWSGNA